MKTCAMTGVAIAAIRPMSHGESRTPQPNGNETRKDS
jgi:hypothetical protein